MSCYPSAPQTEQGWGGWTLTLNREFSVDAPNKAWVTDITYIRTWQGWLYLAVVVDLHARKVIGWSMKPTLA